MPSLTSSPPFDAIDVQDALIAALDADPNVQATFLDSAGAFNPVLDDDPLTVSMAQNLIVVFTLAGEDEADATMGATQGGTADVTNTFAMICYQWEGDNRQPANKRKIVKATGVARAAVMRNRQLVGTPAGGSGPVQLSWTANFRRVGGNVTVYYTPKGFRYSLTLVEFVSRIAFT